MSWTRRIRPLSGPRELQAIRDAAQDIEHGFGRAPSRARVVFETIADCAIIGTAVISGALATVHLYKALFPKEKKEPHEPAEPRPEQSSGKDKPPPHRIAIAERDGHEDDRRRAR